MKLEARVYQAKTDEVQLTSLLTEYRPFIYSVTASVIKRFVDQSSDEASIAALAFCEAIQKYEREKGDFLPFARYVIKNRLVDYIRKEAANIQTVPLEPLENDLTQTEENPVRLEIEALNSELSKYQISFMELEECSPKSFGTKLICKKCVLYLSEHPNLAEQLKKTGLLPVTELASVLDIHRKKIERLRKYLITVIEILTGDYPYLAEYIPYRKELNKR